MRHQTRPQWITCPGTGLPGPAMQVVAAEYTAN